MNAAPMAMTPTPIDASPLRLRSIRGRRRRSRFTMMSSGVQASMISPSPMRQTMAPTMTGMSSMRISALIEGRSHSTELRKQDLRPRVRFLINLLQTLDARMGVDLRRRDGGVAEELLNRPQVRAGIQQVRGKGVAKRVDAQPGVLVDLREQAGDHLLNGAHADPSPCAAKKDGVPISLGTDSAQQLVSFRLVVPQRENRVVSDRDDAFLPALAAHLGLL